MQCAEIMKTDVASVGPEDSAQTAARTMRERGIGFLPVCSAEGTVLGTVTDRDIALRVVADAIPPDTPIGSFMTKNVVACRPTDDVRDAERLMAQERVSRIMCIDESSDRLSGVISLSDLTQLESGGRAARTLRQVSSREARP
jgi:CBS domain-containing protein